MPTALQYERSVTGGISFPQFKCHGPYRCFNRRNSGNHLSASRPHFPSTVTWAEEFEEVGRAPELGGRREEELELCHWGTAPLKTMREQNLCNTNVPLSQCCAPFLAGHGTGRLFQLKDSHKGSHSNAPRYIGQVLVGAGVQMEEAAAIAFLE